MAFLALFLRRIGRDFGDDRHNGYILKACVQLLVHLSPTDLDIVYVAQLCRIHGTKSVSTLSALLLKWSIKRRVRLTTPSAAICSRLFIKLGSTSKAIVKEVVISLCDQGDETPPNTTDASLQVI